jgi:hypothetical protein
MVITRLPCGSDAEERAMLRAEGTAVIRAEPREVLELVLDLDRYREADTKIGRVTLGLALDETGRGRVRYRGRLRGIVTPVDTQDVELVPWSTLTIRGAPGVWTRRTSDFEGTFSCEAVEGGTQVVHTEAFWFKPAPVRWIAEAYLRRWLDDQMASEMVRLKELVEARADRPVPPPR